MILGLHDLTSIILPELILLVVFLVGANPIKDWHAIKNLVIY
jgi:hypothetical protein